MKRHKALISLAILSIFLAAAGPGPVRADTPGERERAEEMAREAIEKLMRALELMIESIPQYEMPEINEDGDIIIRRKRRPPPDESDEPDKPSEPEVEETRI